ncbi:MAG: metal-dependent hydrolase [Alphaproteobacteria bacterium]|nr:metal-dependent hydrolase [Alphaproteobacteria bacterium]
MASLLHVAVGAAAGRLHAGRRSWRASAAFAALSMLPDADVVAFALGIPYAHPFGHRGASHSIAFALGVGALALLATRRGRTALLVAGVVLSHPLLDALTDGGLGVALWWPWDEARVFAPWRPIPVAPIGAAFLSPRGLRVALAEALPSLPLLALALLPARTPKGSALQRTHTSRS